MSIGQSNGSGVALRADSFGGEPTAELLVRQVRLEAEGIVSIELTSPNGGALPAWQPGSHVDVFLDSGLIRQYSLCGPIGDSRCYRIAVLREAAGRGGSEEIHRDVRVGRTLRIGRPRNQFHVPDAAGYLCVAGGVGVTPMLSIVEDAVEREVPVRLVYGGRTERSMSFVSELQDLLPGRALEIVPEDAQGLIDLEQVVKQLPAGWVICACGPAGMLAALEAECDRQGVRDRLVVERFGVSESAKLENELAQAGNRPVTVELRQTGVTVEVPADQTILEAIQDVAPVISSCTEGYCGTCEVRVLKGTPDHRDTVLTDDERASNEIMMVCVSRALTDDLILDI